MEEREDLNIQNTQGGSTPTNQGQGNVGVPSSSSPNRVDGIVNPVNPSASPAPTPPPTIQPSHSYINPNPPIVNPVTPEVMPDIVEEPVETPSVYNAESTINIPPVQTETSSSVQEAETYDQETEELEDYTNPQTAEDGHDQINEEVELEEQPKIDDQEPIEPYACEVTDNIIPHRGVMWYILFSLVFVGSSALIIFFADWVLLTVVIIAAGVLVWRGHQGIKMSFEVNNTGIQINEKKFSFEQINSFYFSKIGNDVTLNIVLMKKLLPRLTYIFLNVDDPQEVKEELGKRVPEQEQREESYVDLLIRRLKL